MVLEGEKPGRRLIYLFYVVVFLKEQKKKKKKRFLEPHAGAFNI